MRIWLITIGEPLPTDGDNVRLLRTGILARVLAGRGHQVTWWSSSFDHSHKRHRGRGGAVLETDDGVRIVLLRSPGYRRNVSLARLRDHREHAAHLTQLAGREPPPDAIVCSAPTIELCVAATRYAGPKGVPVLIDIRDLWPDIFAEVVPRPLRPLAAAALSPYRRALQRALRAATGVSAITPEMLQWGLERAGRSKGPWDRAFPMGYVDSPPHPRELEAARHRWRAQDLEEEGLQACFFGTIGRQFDLSTVIEAARRLYAEGRHTRFVLCGDGERRARFEQEAADCPNVHFPGWVGRADIVALMERSHIGLAPYVDSLNFRLNVPNKPIEYLSGGLPIASSVSGALERLVAEHRCGFIYRDAEELAQFLRRLDDDRAELAQLARNASTLYRERFVADTVYNEMAIHIEGLARAGAS